MNNLNSRISHLWQQFNDHKATRAELDELFGLLSSGEYDEESRRQLQKLLEATPAEEADPARWEPVLQSILHPAATTPSRIRRLVRRTLTAAAILILLVGLFRIWRQSHTGIPAGAAGVAQVMPGGNRATLTLSGGRQIVLDSTAPGDLATQGNTLVEKRGNGQLVYASGGGPEGKIPGSLYNTLRTPRGGQYQLTLPDGTKVWLNAASSLTYPTSFAGQDRVVELTGEAYFEVIHDAKHPFKVMCANHTIEDIGTRFNVNAYVDEPSQVTTLLEGVVSVEGHLLQPGQQATVTPAGQIEVMKGDPQQAIAWKNGLFDFSDAGLEAVMRQVSRWYDVDVIYEGDIPSRQFTGSIGRSLTLDQLLKGLAKERVHYRIESGRRLIIMP